MAEAIAGPALGGAATGLPRSHALVIGAASTGTIFEWYDFYLYGSLASVVAKQFFSGVNETTAYVFALLAFAAGFIVRPLGAALFGRLGDIWGRKNTFLVTMLVMGISTFAVGLLPSSASVGVIAPIALVAFRLLQGLAIGGEYGGAAIYVAEHAPPGRRGLYGSYVQTTATIGLILSLLVILTARKSLGEEAFGSWGWRIPFLVSSVLLAVSMWIRLKLHESPVFVRMVAEGRASARPLKDAFAEPGNIKRMLVGFLGLHSGQAVIFYTAQFYALFFLTRILKADEALANMMVVAGLAIGTPGFVFFGWLSDKVGRKPVILAGFLVAALTIFPLFKTLTVAANPALAAAAARTPVTVTTDPRDCSLQFDPVGKTVFSSACDIAKAYLASAGTPYDVRPAPAGSLAVVRIGDRVLPSFSGEGLAPAEFAARRAAWQAQVSAALKDAGYPARADSAAMNRPLTLGLIVLMMLAVTMVCGPIPAAVVEMYPARIRYTSMSLPFHLGNGWFGGFMPTIAFALVAATGNIYFGLWYPVGIAASSLVICAIWLPETRHADIDA